MLSLVEPSKPLSEMVSKAPMLLLPPLCRQTTFLWRTAPDQPINTKSFDETAIFSSNAFMVTYAKNWCRSDRHLSVDHHSPIFQIIQLRIVTCWLVRHSTWITAWLFPAGWITPGLAVLARHDDDDRPTWVFPCHTEQRSHFVAVEISVPSTRLEWDKIQPGTNLRKGPWWSIMPIMRTINCTRMHGFSVSWWLECTNCWSTIQDLPLRFGRSWRQVRHGWEHDDDDRLFRPFYGKKCKCLSNKHPTWNTFTINSHWGNNEKCPFCKHPTEDHRQLLTCSKNPDANAIQHCIDHPECPFQPDTNTHSPHLQDTARNHILRKEQRSKQTLEMPLVAIHSFTRQNNGDLDLRPTHGKRCHYNRESPHHRTTSKFGSTPISINKLIVSSLTNDTLCKRNTYCTVYSTRSTTTILSQDAFSTRRRWFQCTMIIRTKYMTYTLDSYCQTTIQRFFPTLQYVIKSICSSV